MHGIMCSLHYMHRDNFACILHSTMWQSSESMEEVCTSRCLCTDVHHIKMDLNESRCRRGLNSSGSGQNPVMGSCEHGSRASDSINWRIS
jgi:hypothetical protein